MEPHRHDPVSQPPCTPAMAFGEPEKSAQTLPVNADRAPTAAAAVPAHDSPVDVGDNDRIQGNAPLAEPVEEAVNRMATIADRRLGPSALFAHPLPEDRDLGDVGVSLPHPTGLIEQIREA